VAVTGLGAITALGATARETWSGLASGTSGIRPWQNLAPSSVATPVGAEVVGFAPEAHFAARRLPALDRVSQLALVAAREAVRDAALAERSALGERAAVVIGTGIGGQSTQEDAYRRLFTEQARRFHPLIVPRAMPSAAASQISIELGARGPSFAVTSACASGAHALAQAAALIRAGLADIAIAGGAEACLTPGVIKSWEALRVLARDTCRPFSKDRTGLVLGEGAAVLVLESEAHAGARGANVHAWLAGCGMSSDAHDLVQPDVDGEVRALRAALRDAALAPEDIDYVNAHGTGTVSNDAIETRALREAFGAHADALAVSSTKSMHGHALGASGAIEALATVLAIQHGLIPPTAGFTAPGPGCDLDYVPNRARAARVRAALSSSFAFGGSNAVLVFVAA
jgi:nodulation protein E